MSNAESIRKRVKEFAANHPTGQTEADSFAAWWIHRRFKVDAMEAAKRAPGGNHDYGIDGYFLERTGPIPTLHLIQAKYTENETQIKKAFTGFQRTLQPLGQFLSGHEFSAVHINPVIHNLAAELAVLRAEDPTAIDNLNVSFRVVHLCETESESVDNACKGSMIALGDAVRTALPAGVTCDAIQEQPKSLVQGVMLVAKASEKSIRFHGEAIPSAQEVQHLAGFGYLADLVGLYEEYREALFSKNVRSFQMDKIKKGPAGHMRETLREICIPTKKGSYSARPDSFALYHNGVTLTATKATPDASQGKLALVNPNVLNGCQTIKNAFLMLRAEGATSKLIDIERWQQVVVPVRVVVTTDEAMVRRITVGLNRQNAIRPAAFRANEPDQVKLAQRFADIGIFYERQEKAFKNLRTSDPAALGLSYPNSTHAPLGMEELAQTIASMAEKPAVSGISNISELFEDGLYGQIFSEERLEHLEKLVFLRNVFACSPFVARDLRKKAKSLAPLQPGKFRYILARALGRYAIKKQLQEVEEFGTTVEYKFGPQHPLRLKLLSLCSHMHTGIQQDLPALWSLGDGEGWRSPTDADACHKLLKKAKVDQFDVWQA